MWSIELFRGRSNCSSVILARHAATCVHSHIRMYWRKPLHACMIYASSCTHYCCRAIRACSWSGSDAVPRLQASLLVRSCHPKEVDTYILLASRHFSVISNAVEGRWSHIAAGWGWGTWTLLVAPHGCAAHMCTHG